MIVCSAVNANLWIHFECVIYMKCLKLAVMYPIYLEIIRLEFQSEQIYP
jgi:hypothetical protein